MPDPETPGTQRALLLEIAELKRELADQTSRKKRSLQLAIAASLLLHGIVALIPQQKPKTGSSGNSYGRHPAHRS